MKIWYDCEFIDNGRTIDPISIGMIRETGEEYYAVFDGFGKRAFAANQWLMDNVWPTLPQVRGDERMRRIVAMRSRPSNYKVVKNLFMFGHHDVKSRDQIKADVFEFISETPDPQLWAWYGAYDHVLYAQLFGKMINLPEGFPMYTNDLKQECNRLGNPEIPKQGEGKHNALDDARHNRVIDWFLQTHERGQFIINGWKEGIDGQL